MENINVLSITADFIGFNGIHDRFDLEGLHFKGIQSFLGIDYIRAILPAWFFNYLVHFIWQA